MTRRPEDGEHGHRQQHRVQAGHHRHPGDLRVPENLGDAQARPASRQRAHPRVPGTGRSAAAPASRAAPAAILAGAPHASPATSHHRPVPLRFRIRSSSRRHAFRAVTAASGFCPPPASMTVDPGGGHRRRSCGNSSATTTASGLAAHPRIRGMAETAGSGFRASIDGVRPRPDAR